ncbi:DUF4258 domain-containing protein [Sulfitobacter sp. M22]|jgi:hypothetical protein|uniref:DUF4258 domain-containing protein n=1 Tax=Sulfitobacter sp. M22 TaxID=2675332 RepID=UPI001B3E6570|nr:DUF4258 domain-containing protein [Sulfitobacter sp. M22]MBQ0772864.1 DUF4258 domain-containing protein [Sphingomonadales bacterium]MCF7728705.1 DUF4258 domain-containing protein [Sulfitobacter sp. M22]
MKKTKHMDARMNQRGITQELVDLALEYGEPVGDKTILGRKQCHEILTNLQREMKVLQKVMSKGGITVVSAGEELITTYRTDSYSSVAARK